MKMEKTAAYQGPGWQTRRRRLAEEITSDARIWGGFHVNSEWSRLEAVALYRPRTELRAIRDPRRVQHLRPLVLPRLAREYRALTSTFKELGVRVIELNPLLLPKNLQTAPPNLMFVRDLFFNTAEGCVIGRMASRVRAGEEKFAAAALAGQGVPIRATLGGGALFEGADALWLDSRTVLCGVGARTNREAFVQLRELLRHQGVKCLAVAMPRGVQHLLGLLQIAGPDIAVVRTQKAPQALLALLRRHGFQIVEIQESEEVTHRQAMNFVTIDKRRIIMASACPQMRAQLVAAGLKIAAEIEISQLCNAAGGLACATGIVSRRMVK